MTASSVALVILSAFFHAYWNFLLKKSSCENKGVFILAFLSFSIILLSPVAFVFHFWPAQIDLSIFLIIISAFLKFLYFKFIIKAYESGDLSFVYPFTRISIVLVPIFAYFIIGERIPLQGLLGILIIFLAGFLLLYSQKTKQSHLNIFNNKVFKNSILVSLVIAFYSIVDKLAITKYNPVFFIFCMFFFTWVIFLLDNLRFKTSRYAFNTFVNFKKEIIQIALFCPLSYLLLLYAFSLSKVSYVLALRQVSLFFAIFFGGKFLAEKNYLFRLFAAMIIFTGFYLIISSG